MIKVSLDEAKALRADAFAVWRFSWPLTVVAFVILVGFVIGAGHAYGGVPLAVAGGLLAVLSGIWFWRSHYLALTVDSIVIGRAFWAWTVDLFEITELYPDKWGIHVGTESGRSLDAGVLQEGDIFRWFGARSRARWACDQIKRQAERQGNLAIHTDDSRELFDIRRRKDVVPP